MTALRTVVFVDGQNFKNNLQSFSYQSNPRDRGYMLDENILIGVSSLNLFSLNSMVPPTTIID
jgi:hypothetical protein